jgi:hydrogenase maturation protease
MLKDHLIIGIGNPCRNDDALGYHFISYLEDKVDVDIKHCYQLQIEDAEMILHYKKVSFVDAAKNQNDCYQLQTIEARSQTAFSSHSLGCSDILATCQELYNYTPQCQLLSIRGENFEIGESLSDKATQALQRVYSENPLELNIKTHV